MAAPVVLHIFWAEGVDVVHILHYYFHEPIEFWALNTQQGVIWAGIKFQFFQYSGCPCP